MRKINRSSYNKMSTERFTNVLRKNQFMVFDILKLKINVYINLKKLFNSDLPKSMQLYFTNISIS